MALNFNKVHDVEHGLKITDGQTDGPIYTGGPSSPVGLDFPVGTFYVQNVTGGGVLWRKHGVGVNDWVKASPVDFYQSASSTAESTTTSTTTYATKLTLVTPALPLGDYRVAWRYKWKAANANRGIQSQVLNNGVEISNSINFSANVAAYPSVANFIPVTSISGVRTFTFNFRVGIGATTITVGDYYAEFWRVS